MTKYEMQELMDGLHTILLWVVLGVVALLMMAAVTVVGVATYVQSSKATPAPLQVELMGGQHCQLEQGADNVAKVVCYGE